MEWMPLSEAAKLWSKDSSSLRWAIKDGRFKEGVDVKKIGFMWIVNPKSMERLYGPLKEDING